MQKIAQKWYDRWCMEKKKRLRMQDQYIRLRQENRQLKAQQSCAKDVNKSAYTRDEQP